MNVFSEGAFSNLDQVSTLMSHNVIQKLSAASHNEYDTRTRGFYRSRETVLHLPIL